LEVVVVAAVVRNGTIFSQCSVVGETFHSLGDQDVVSFILFDALFLLDGGRRREGKKEEKKNTLGMESFPGARPALLAVL
jgi:hypothetical protein